MSLPHYKPEGRRLYIDSLKKSLKRVLLHNGNLFGSIPIGHLVILKKEYTNIKTVLDKLKYHEHGWLILWI